VKRGLTSRAVFHQIDAVTRLQGSSSDAAGIQQGDELLSIDGVPLTSQSPFQAASLLQVRASTRSEGYAACSLAAIRGHFWPPQSGEPLPVRDASGSLR